MRNSYYFLFSFFVFVGLSFFVSGYTDNVMPRISGDHNTFIDLNRDLYKISSEEISLTSRVASIFGVGKAVEKKNRLVVESLERKDAMLDLVEEKPSSFLSQAIPEEEQNEKFEDVKENLETETSQEGILLIMENPHFHDPENVNNHEGIDNFNYFLDTKDNRYNLKFADGSAPSALSGSKVRVKGVELENYLATSSAEASGFELLESVSQIREENYGVQKIAIIITKAPGSSDYSLPFIEENMNDANDYFKEVSYGRASLEWDVYGPYETPYSSSYATYYDPSFYDSVYGQLVNESIDKEINFSEYSRVISIDDRSCYACGSVGAGTHITDEGVLNLSTSWLWPLNFQYLGGNVVAHELGHNFGVYHANRLVCGDKSIDNFNECVSYEYGDAFDVMGASYNMGHINSLHKEIITWLRNNEIVEANSDGIYAINAFENLSDRTALKIPRKFDEFGNNKNFYYLEYRTAVGQDSFIDLTQFQNGPQVRIDKYYSGGGGGGDSQLLAMNPGSYPNNVGIGVGNVFFDPASNVEVRTFDVNSKNATVQIKVSNKTCIRRTPTFNIYPLNISGTMHETFYYSFELINNDENVCPAREIYLNNSNRAVSFYMESYPTWMSSSPDYPSLIASGEKIEGSIMLYPNYLSNGGELSVDILNAKSGIIYASQNLEYHVVSSNNDPVSFGGEDKARKFFYARNDLGSDSYYLIDERGKIYRRGSTWFTTDNVKEFPVGNSLKTALYDSSNSLLLLDSDNVLYEGGRNIISRINKFDKMQIDNSLPYSYHNVQDIDIYESVYDNYNSIRNLLILLDDGYIFTSSVILDTGSCITWDGRRDLEREDESHTVALLPWNDFNKPGGDIYSLETAGYYVLSKDGTIYACEDADVSYTHFNQPLPAGLGTGDRTAVAFALDQEKGIVMVDSYGEVYTSGTLTHQGSPSFGQNIATDIQILPNGAGVGYGVLKGTGEIISCSGGSCGTGMFVCDEDKDCDDLNDDTMDSCINPGTTESYCRNDGGSDGLGDENYPLFFGTMPIFIGDSLNKGVKTLIAVDMPKTLKNGFVGEIEYEQRIKIGDYSKFENSVQPTDDSPKDYNIHLGTTPSTQYLYNLTINFDREIYPTDLIGKNIYLFGRTYTVSSQTTNNKIFLSTPKGDLLEIPMNGLAVRKNQQTIDGTESHGFSQGSNPANGKITIFTISVTARDSSTDAIVVGSSFVDPVFENIKVNFRAVATVNDNDHGGQPAVSAQVYLVSDLSGSSGKTCTDSDGFDINTFGNVNYDGVVYNDECNGDKGIIEYTCASSGWFSSEKEVKANNRECQHSCVEGKCVDQDENVQRICSDDDASNNLNVYGTVLFKGDEYKDSCAESGLSVKQYFCVDDKLRNFVKRCANGMRCISGSCQYILVAVDK